MWKLLPIGVTAGLILLRRKRLFNEVDPLECGNAVYGIPYCYITE